MYISLNKPFNLLRPSSWVYAAWTLLYAMLWLFPLNGGKIPRVFAETLAADFLINLGTPFIIFGAGMVYMAFTERPRRVKWFVWPLLVLLALGCVGVPFTLLYKAGGWLLVTGTVLFFTHAGWFLHRHQDGVGLGMLFARGLLGPWLFMVPALVVSALVVKRQTLGFENTDWVPLFGIIYFGIQTAFEEFLLRMVLKARAKENSSYKIE
jgi:hypothetical protein